MSPRLPSLDSITAALVCIAMTSCAYPVDGDPRPATEQGAAGGPPLGVSEAALNGSAIVSSNCDPHGAKILEVMRVARANLVNPAMLDCMRNAIFGYTSSFPEFVLAEMQEDMPTFVACANLDSGAEAEVDQSPEMITFDRTFIANANVSMAAALALHEVAHNKGYRHPDDVHASLLLDNEDALEYEHSVNEHIAKCSTDISNGFRPPRPNGPRRDSLLRETTLAPVGGSGGSGYDIRCEAIGFGAGLQVRAGSVIDAVGLMCGTGFGTVASAMAGGSGGSYHTMTCASDELLIGVRGRADHRAVALGAICQKLASVQQRQRPAADVRNVGLFGGTAGVSFERTCPLGMSVRGIRGKSGSIVDRLELDCSDTNSFGAIETTPRPWSGGSGGSLSVVKCPGRAALTGLTYHAGTRLDRLGGICRQAVTSCSGGGCTENVSGAEYFMMAHGGTNGKVAEERCASGAALVGLRLRTGTRVDSAAGLCADARTWSGTGTAPVPQPLFAHGGTGGNPVDRVCPRGEFMTGWWIRSGSEIDAIRPVCRNFP